MLFLAMLTVYSPEHFFCLHSNPFDFDDHVAEVFPNATKKQCDVILPAIFAYHNHRPPPLLLRSAILEPCATSCSTLCSGGDMLISCPIERPHTHILTCSIRFSPKGISRENDSFLKLSSVKHRLQRTHCLNIVHLLVSKMAKNFSRSV